MSNRKDKLTIGLLGSALNNSNMGYVALTYSLISMLNNISKDLDRRFDYILFESVPNNEKTAACMEELDMKDINIQISRIANPHGIRGLIRINRMIQMKAGLKKCDIVIDMTGGDSFSDIYGDKRFLFWSGIKQYVLDIGKSLILGPQTIGPFEKNSNRQIAAGIISRSSLTIARDEASAKYVKEVMDMVIPCTMDIAFALPYHKEDTASEQLDDKIKVGLNISGLLTSDNYETNTSFDTKLSTNYDEYIDKVLDYLTGYEKHEVYLIPHVDIDVYAIEGYHKKYPSSISVEFIDNPVKMKSIISGMDIMIGSRLHATIAAFSSSVATIPVAYSRKFEGLYNTLDYKYIVDLNNDDTKTSVDKTIEYINDYETLQKDVTNCNKTIQKRTCETIRLIKGAMEKVNA